MARFLGGVLVCAALTIWAAVATAQTEERVALVVGNGKYDHLARLPNPANEAQLIATTLQTVGFELIGGKAQTDLDRASFEHAIREFGAKLAGGSVGLFYYAGHGLQLQGANYLVPISADPTTAADADFELIDAAVVLKQMEAAGSKLNLVILDACRNNPFSATTLRGAGGGLAQMKAPRGTLISYATQPGNVALDGTTGHSPYTAALAASIQKPGAPVLDVFNDVGLAVDKVTGGRQQPWVSTSPLEGVFYFQAPVAPAAPPPVAASTPASPDAEILFWQTIAQSNNPADFQEYLRLYPQGRFAGLARNRLPGQPPVAPRLTPAPPRCGGNSDEQVIEPVRLLYQAVNSKNIDLYAAQWSDDAMYRDVSTGTVRTKADKIAERRARFAAWEQVRLTMNSAAVTERAIDNATITVIYSMTVKNYGRPPFSQTNVGENYIVICGHEGRWLIRHNIDDNRSR
jgi:hypothetical protein